MKLLFCFKCGDVRAILPHWTACNCGEARARYADDRYTAEWNGLGALLGINNTSLLEAVMAHRVGDRPDGMGHEFCAFILPDKCDTVVKV